MCKQESSPDKSTKIYTRKELVMMETTISDFHTSFYIPGSHIYAKASDMENAKICTYPQSEHALPHWKYVLRCCADCPCINIPDQEKEKT